MRELASLGAALGLPPLPLPLPPPASPDLISPDSFQAPTTATAAGGPTGEPRPALLPAPSLTQKPALEALAAALCDSDLELAIITRAKAELRAHLTEQQGREASLRTELDATEAERAAVAQARDALAERLAEEEAKVHSLTANLAHAQRAASEGRAEAQLLRSEARPSPSELAAAEGKASKAEAESAALRSQLAEQASQLERLESGRRESEALRAQLQERLECQQVELAESQSRSAEAQEAQAQAASEYAAAQARLLSEQQERIAAAKNGQEEIRSLNVKLSQAQADIQRLQSEQETKDRQGKEAVEGLEAGLRDAESELASFHALHEREAAEIASLEGQLAAYASTAVELEEAATAEVRKVSITADSLANRLATTEAELAWTEAELASAQTRLRSASAESAGLAGTLAERDAALAAAEKEVERHSIASLGDRQHAARGAAEEVKLLKESHDQVRLAPTRKGERSECWWLKELRRLQEILDSSRLEVQALHRERSGLQAQLTQLQAMVCHRVPPSIPHAPSVEGGDLAPSLRCPHHGAANPDPHFRLHPFNRLEAVSCLPWEQEDEEDVEDTPPHPSPLLSLEEDEADGDFTPLFLSVPRLPEPRRLAQFKLSALE